MTRPSAARAALRACVLGALAAALLAACSQGGPSGASSAGTAPTAADAPGAGADAGEPRVFAAPNPGDARATLEAARAAVADDRLGDAEQWLRAALDARNPDVEVAIEYAKLMGRLGRYRESVAVLQPRAGDDVRLLNLLGYAQLVAGDAEGARSNLSASIAGARKVGRDYAPPHYHLGLLLLQEGKAAEAKDEFREAARINPKHLEATYQWIGTAERTGDAAGAAEARAAFAALNVERLAAQGALDDNAVPNPYPVARGTDVETRAAVADAAFTRSFPAGATVEVACRGPRGAAARFTAEVQEGGAPGGAAAGASAGGRRLLDVVHEGDPGRAAWVPHRLDLPPAAAGGGPVTVTFRVRPASRWAGWFGGAPPEGAAFSEPAWLGAETTRSADPRPNVVLIVLDTLRADAVSAYGGPAGATPAIDRLAAAGTRFAQAEAAASWTLPSHYSLFSGLTPLAHGVMPNLSAAEGYLFPDRRIAVKGSGREVMLAEAFEKAGYRTAAVTESGWVAPGFGLGQGFRVYRAALEGSLPGTAAGTMAELEFGGTRGPWFLFVHTYAPHTPYHAPKAYRTRFAAASHAGFAFPRARVPIEDFNRFKLPLFPPAPSDVNAFRDVYRGQVAWSDTLVGAVADWLREKGLLEQTVIVVTSDHGEEIFERGAFDHGATLHEEVTHVPLVVHAPGRVPAGRVIGGPVSLVDVPATLLDLAGLGGRHGEGRSLAPLWTGAEAPGTRTVFAHAISKRGESLGATWQGSLKYLRTETIAGRAEQVFDLRADPGEARALPAPGTAPRAADVARLRAAYDAHVEQARKVNALLGATEEKLDKETLEQLKSLGYVQ